MLLGEARGHPDDGHRVEAGRIGQKLAKVAVVGALQLVLDQHPMVATDVPAQDIGAERPDGLLLGLQFELQAQRLAQHGQVLWLCQPRRERRGLVGPDIAKIVTLQASELKCGHHIFPSLSMSLVLLQTHGGPAGHGHIASNAPGIHSKVAGAPTTARNGE